MIPSSMPLSNTLLVTITSDARFISVAITLAPVPPLIKKHLAILLAGSHQLRAWYPLFCPLRLVFSPWIAWNRRRRERTEQPLRNECQRSYILDVITGNLLKGQRLTKNAVLLVVQPHLKSVQISRVREPTPCGYLLERPTRYWQHQVSLERKQQVECRHCLPY